MFLNLSIIYDSASGITFNINLFLLNVDTDFLDPLQRILAIKNLMKGNFYEFKKILKSFNLKF
ncbi:hypothetical protein BpHYR1_045607 [Brachionus plicatilis]|uniref:Uncharacterized protein n=1 Tax=Brachionus plicatilis TaxID=10195 RepID=A0A3M7S617_BRAPC|nr:hypothetical protein BpHYR1_045607 [Brachionus plicatilis]